MNDDTAAPVETLQALPSTDTIYIVQIGDSLSKIAQKFYGNPALFPVIAERNNINPQSILYIGARLIIPPATASGAPSTLPSSPGGSAPVAYDDQVIETVTTTAPRIQWYQDWRIWAGVAILVGGVWYFNRKSK